MSGDYLDGPNPPEIAYQLRIEKYSSSKWPVVGHLAKYIAMKIAAGSAIFWVFFTPSRQISGPHSFLIE